MVKKSRFLDKIKDRMRTGGVRVESNPAADRAAAPRTSGGSPGGASASRTSNPGSTASGGASAPKSATAGSKSGPQSGPQSSSQSASKGPGASEPTRPVDAVARRAAEAKVSRRLTPQEDASLAMRDGFQELGSLLRGMQSRIDNQGEQLAKTMENVNQLPAIGQQQLETLRRLADRFDRQSEQSAVLARSLGDLPQTLKAVQQSLDRAAATDERQAKSLDEFRSNMSRINDSMSKMVDHSKSESAAARAMVESERKALSQSIDSLSKQQKSATEDAATRLGAAHDSGVKALTKIQQQQAQRLEQLVESGSKTNRWVVTLLALVFVALVVVATLLATA